MTTGFYGRGYYIAGYWEARPQSPSQIAQRFVRYIDLLHGIDPLFDLWMTGVDGPTDFETVRDRFEDIVAANVSKDDLGEPELIYGNLLGACTREYPESLTYSILLREGCYSTTIKNSAILQCRRPDPRAVTYQIFKAALLATVEVWNPGDCVACPDDIYDFVDRSRYFSEVWMQYLSAPLARLITPPATSINEWLPNGGLLMSATTETFLTDNPAHLAVARDIAAATAPLNDLPYAYLP